MVACQSSGKDFETSPGVLGSKAHGVHYFRLVKGPRCFSQGYIVGDDYLGCLQLSADGGKLDFWGFLPHKNPQIPIFPICINKKYFYMRQL